jgi:plastocyanin domain-containing protein
MKRNITCLAAIVLGAAALSCSKPSAGTEGTALAKDAPALDGRRIDITAGPEGYSPATVEAKKGESLVLRFTRTTKSECLASVVFPDLKISRELPLNTAVEIPVKADKVGKIGFQCGMNMVHGSVNVTGS